MAGISELKDVLKAGISIGEALADGIDIGDIVALMDLPAAIDGIKEVPAEVADLDEAELEEINDFIKTEFDLPDEDLEAFIEEALSWALSTYKLYIRFKELKEDEESPE